MPVEELADALRVEADEVAAGLRALAVALEGRGVVLRELAGGWTLASHPDAEEAARRLLARPRTPALTPAQAETLSIVAYLQPVSRPEVARIRGVASESAAAALVERGLIEEAGRSQFGAILYRTTPLFLKLFGLRSVDELPDPAQWDPSPEEQAALRDRLLRAGEERAGAPALDSRRRERVRRELPAGGVDVAPAGEPDGRAQPVLLQRGAEGVDRAARRAVVGARRVVRDQVDLVALGIEQLRERDRLAVVVVDAREHHVLDEHLAPAALVVRVAGGEHVGDRMAVVDRHDLRAQRVVGRVQRERQPQRHVGLRQPPDAGQPADGRDASCGGG